MRWLDALAFHLRSLRARRADLEMDEELRFHVEEMAAENERRGMAPEEARRAALREFGGVLQVKEELRDLRGLNLVDAVSQDVRHGVRLLWKSPGFASAAILTVALGIGASTAVFSVVYGVLLRPLPYPQPERLVQLWLKLPRLGLDRAFVGPAIYRDWRAQSQVFEELALVRPIANFNLTGEGGEPERLQAARVTASLFRVLGVSPPLGRTFRDDEERIGHDDVVILSHGLWRRRFLSDPTIVGKDILLSGVPHRVVGVMDPDFQYPGREFQVWVPLTVNPDDYTSRANYSFLSVGRLRPGRTLAQAQAEMDTIAARLGQQYPESDRGVRVLAAPMLADTVRGVRTPLYLLLGAVGCVLAIGCANLANLLLARSLGRSSELVVRSALGAGRGRLVLQSVAELVPILALGGVGGLLVARGILALVLPRLPAAMPRVEAIGLSAPVLVFAFATLALAGLASGVWPALQIGHWDVAATLRESLRGGTTGLRGTRLRDLLVVSQMAIAVLLVAGAVLLTRSFVALRGVDPGFRTEGRLSLHLAIPRSKYGKDREVAEFCRRVLERVTALPGVASAGMVNRLPLGGVAQIGTIEAEASVLADGRIDAVDWRTVTPDYFRTLDIPLLRGRGFTEADADPDRPVGIVDEQVARLAWPGQDPIGRRFRIPARLPDGSRLPWVEIVGVAGHIRHDRLAEDTRPQVYWNYHQRAQDRMALVVRTDGRPESLVPSVVGAIRAVDPEQAVYDVRTMDEVKDRSVAQQWLTTSGLALFAGTALVLASVGLYGVISYSVGRRSREIGIRMALGARRSSVLGLVLRQGALLTAAGGVLGLGGALAVARVLSGQVYAVGVRDALSFATAALVLGIVGLLATLLPARRAAGVDPMTVLRAD
jgi:putative ABC transport system permease protein